MLHNTYRMTGARSSTSCMYKIEQNKAATRERYDRAKRQICEHKAKAMV
jgi:hypothetical protein